MHAIWISSILSSAGHGWVLSQGEWFLSMGSHWTEHSGSSGGVVSDEVIGIGLSTLEAQGEWCQTKSLDNRGSYGTQHSTEYSPRNFETAQFLQKWPQTYR